MELRKRIEELNEEATRLQAQGDLEAGNTLRILANQLRSELAEEQGVWNEWIRESRKRKN